MDVTFIKKEEPAEFTLISTYEDQGTCDEFQSMDIYTIKFKEEPTDDSKDSNSHDDATTDSASISDYAPESEDTDESLSESDIFKKKTAAKNSSKPKSSNKRWECTKCFKTFRRKCLLVTHVKNHRNMSELDLCKICRRYYPKSNREFHLNLHNGPPFVCLVCRKEFPTSEKYRCHIKIHKEKKHSCEICHKSFLSKSLLRMHIQIHQEREKPFQCDICKISFFRRNTMLRHKRNLHSGAPRMLKYTCPNTNCNREYLRRGDFLKHKCSADGTQTPENCPTCFKTFATLTAMKVHCRRYHEQGFGILFCQKCKKTFRGFDYYVLHTQQNCPDKIVYECDLCSKLFERKLALHDHFANAHNIFSLKKAQCSLCGKSFSSKRRLTLHLQVHEKLANTEKKTTECKYCSRIFQVKSQCITHMNSLCSLRKSFDDNLTYENGSNHQTFECDICGLTFTQKCAIIDHMTIMHSTISIAGKSFMKKFNCSMNQRILQLYPCCDENFIDERVNEKHNVKKTCTFPCKKCKKQYANLYSLLRHCAEHTSKVHQSLRHLQQCKNCDRLFKWKRSIPEHLQSLEDRLKCLFCQKEFKSKTYYNKHVDKCKLK